MREKELCWFEAGPEVNTTVNISPMRPGVVYSILVKGNLTRVNSDGSDTRKHRSFSVDLFNHLHDYKDGSISLYQKEETSTSGHPITSYTSQVASIFN